MFFQLAKKAPILWIFGLFVINAVISSCVLGPEEYDGAQDDGTYTGTMVVYDGPGTDPDFIDRTCPEISATMVVSGDSVVLTTSDDYPNYEFCAPVGGRRVYTCADAPVVNHSASTTSFGNNQFKLETTWDIDKSDTQLSDLMNLEVCGATPPSLPGDPSTGGRGRLIEFALRVDEPGFVGEYGNGAVRGSLFYGVKCTGDEYIPLCVYFMQLSKN